MIRLISKKFPIIEGKYDENVDRQREQRKNKFFIKDNNNYKDKGKYKYKTNTIIKTKMMRMLTDKAIAKKIQYPIFCPNNEHWHRVVSAVVSFSWCHSVIVLFCHCVIVSLCHCDMVSL